MKTWEKILLYPIGLCYWIADWAKTAGKFMGRKVKPGIAMLVAVTMLLSLMPLTAFAVSVPSGYTTDENGIMAYAYFLSGNFDIRGYFDGEWKSTTYDNGGYYTYLKQGGYTQSVSASSSANGGFTRNNLNTLEVATAPAPLDGVTAFSNTPLSYEDQEITIYLGIILHSLSNNCSPKV